MPRGRKASRGPTSRQAHAQPKVEDGFLIALAKQGDPTAYHRLVARYQGFVRLKASSYFLAGGDSYDLIQEGLIGVYKAIRDYRSDREFELPQLRRACITRQIITAVKTATRNKHTPLNHYVSFSGPAGGGTDEEAPSLDEQIAGPATNDPASRVVSTEELRSLVGCLSTALSQLESNVLADRRPLRRGDRRSPRL